MTWTQAPATPAISGGQYVIKLMLWQNIISICLPHSYTNLRSAEIGQDSAGATKYKGRETVSPVIFAMPAIGKDLEKLGGDDDWGNMS